MSNLAPTEMEELAQEKLALEKEIREIRARIELFNEENLDKDIIATRVRIALLKEENDEIDSAINDIQIAILSVKINILMHGLVEDSTLLITQSG